MGRGQLNGNPAQSYLTRISSLPKLLASDSGLHLSREKARAGEKGRLEPAFQCQPDEADHESPTDRRAEGGDDEARDEFPCPVEQ